MRYKWILFDADNTLFDFNSLDGLKSVFSKRGYDFTESDFAEYRSLNRMLWEQFQAGEISSDQLKERRFKKWERTMNLSAHELNSAFLNEMSLLSRPLEKTKEVIKKLSPKISLSIITNGFSQVQHPRIHRADLNGHFDIIISSEEARVAKPDKRIFEQTLEKLGNPPKEQVLMVGDGLDSDIKGGNNFGIDTCWFNSKKEVNKEDVSPTYEISCLTEILSLVFKSRSNQDCWEG